MAIRSFNDLNKRQQLAVLIGVPAVVAIILFVLIYRALGVLGPDRDGKLPGFMLRTTPKSLWGDIQIAEEGIAAQDVIIARRPKVEKELANLEADIKAGRERLPLESEKPEMRLLIEKLARDIPSDIGNVQVQSVRITEGQGGAATRAAGAQMQTVTYQTDITGDLNGIIKYIDTIEKNPRFMRVSAFSIRPGAVGMDADKKMVFQQHSVKMTIVTYVYNPGKGK
jgi:hypothetical protein